MNDLAYGRDNPRPFIAYSRGEFDLELGNYRKARKPKRSIFDMAGLVKSILNRLHYYYALHPLAISLISLSLGVIILLFLPVRGYGLRLISSSKDFDAGLNSYPFTTLRNLVMVAGHSVYINGCRKADQEDSWFLESYQKYRGQAATFLSHIRQGVEIAARDDKALLLFSGGETRKDAGPRSEAQSYWAVAESKDWFGKQDEMRWRALTEEHARDSFENVLFSICRFRELTGKYPYNITVVSYDFKEERFVHLHRHAIGFPEARFFYSGTPTSSKSMEAAIKGEALVRAQFHGDPYGCSTALYQKRLKRDPFRHTIPYPSGCPELARLFKYCGTAPYPGTLPWAEGNF